MKTLNEKKVLTRKAHICHCCLRKFDAGNQMLNKILADGSEIYSLYICTTCEQLTEFYPDEFIDLDNLFYEGCVDNNLSDEQTPEDLLTELQEQKT